MKQIRLLSLLLIVLSGCVTPPKIVEEFISNDLPQNCKNLFLNVQYQESANTPALSQSYFAVAKLDNGNIVACGSSWGGKLATTNLQIKAKALKGCESIRLDYMKQNSIVVNECEIYAEGNKILAKNFNPDSS